MSCYFCWLMLLVVFTVRTSARNLRSWRHFCKYCWPLGNLTQLSSLPSPGPCCRDTTRRLAVAWLLASACLVHHLTHWLGGSAPAWLHLLSATPVHATLSAMALLGELLLHGLSFP